jgi:DivIVA domain-containing protein
VDRDGIERHDFPTGRRGYAPEAVDAHLRRVADEFEALRDRARQPPAPLSTGTSEQVRLILEAAERSAADLRAQAGDEAGAHVARVGKAAEGMLARLGDLERELGGLVDALRRGGERLTAGLAELQAEVSGAAPAPQAAPADPLPAANGDPAALGAASNADALGPGADEAGARLIALNMALSGAPREETARYLAEHFALADADALLDDVYARADR